MIPHELWQKIFTFLDLKSQNNVSKVSGDFCELIVSIWRSSITRLIPQFDVISEGHDIVRLNLTMKSFLEDRKDNTPGEHSEYSFLYKILHQYKILKQIHHLEEIGDCHENFKKVRLIFCCQCYLLDSIYLPFCSIYSSTTTTCSIANILISIKNGPGLDRRLWRSLSNKIR